MKPWAEWFYNGVAWKGCREAYLQSKGYLCERCAEEDKLIIADVVHHKIYLTPDNIRDQSIALSWDNLEAICQTCHNREHHPRAVKPRYGFDDDGNIIPPNQNPKRRGTNTERGP